MSSTATAPEDPVAIVGERVLTRHDLDEALGDRLSKLKADEYARTRSVLEELVDTTLLEEEARRRGITRVDLLRQEVDAKVESATSDQVKAVFEATRDRYSERSETVALAAVEARIRNQRSVQRYKFFLAELRRRSNIQIRLQPPRVTFKSTEGPSKGPADAPITIVSFSDYECPFCARGEGILSELMAAYPGKIRVTVRDLPLPIHPNAPKAAEAAACAGEGGRFWEMHDRLFANQKSLSLGDLKR